MKISLHGIEKKYGKFEALKNVSFEYEEGKFYGLLGPNGAGKTTLFSLLIQTVKQTKGTIVWSEKSNIVKAEHLYKKIGVVFQTSRLDKFLTVEENLLSRGALYGLDKKETLKNLSDLKHFLNIDELKNKKYGTLSGGQKRKVDIVRALIHKPSVLLLDEPTTGLDPQSRQSLWEAIYGLNKEKGMTIILITHYLEEMTFCDRVDILVHGALLYSGTTEDLVKKNSTTKLKVNMKNGETLKKENFTFIEDEDGNFVAEGLNIDEIVTVVSENRGKIKNFDVQQASLETAYLNLIKNIEREEL
ncbi:ABC transporter ATP-binding protein [Lactococcus garvieae subsp. garvieae]|uniref:ABC transporter ATP-binding protein n=1 Tax=Lactococcus garvieae TaxID=1363 RepID=UPI0005AB04E7|nr:ABC transporter ATP-binding protein [Lactococcus garvieae]KAA8710679.1 ABC transporter ATP-binding protein [Lactococcus garvieae subsp. garvieae]MDG6192266.1 ABC transporter ATP-binding protein [Lactococcus garvieae]QPR49403.1 ABC transporter ATP-binding protein [Lactococcus garvieae]